MDVKQEPVDSYEETVIIKQESVSINPQNIIKVEEHDWASQLSATEAVPIPKQEPKVESLLANSLNEIAEVSASDYFVHTNDVVSIKRENPEFDIRVSELLTEQCDLPTIKSENIDYYNQPCSSKQAQQLSRQRKTVRKKVDKIKRKRRYPCPICRKSPLKRKHFNLHFKTFVVCSLCGHFFVHKKEFLNHYFRHLTKRSKNKFQINLKRPNRTLSSELNLKDSNQDLNDSKSKKNVKGCNFKCEYCPRVFFGRAYLMQHLKSYICRRMFQCHICLKNFKTKQHLKYHVSAHYGIRSFKCEICSNAFRTKYILKSHMLLHNNNAKRHQCEFCYKSYRRPYLLRVHTLTHTDLKQVQCEICLKKLNIKQSLLNHTGKDSFKCDQCLKEKLIGEYKCENCFVKFKNKKIFDKHLVVNRLENPFKCKICSKLFTHKCHTFTHSLNNIFLECEICKQKFQGKATLTRHKYEKH